MIRVDSDVVIRRPVPEVFAFVTETADDPRWHLDAVDVTKTSGGAIGVETRGHPIHGTARRAVARDGVRAQPPRGDRRRGRAVNPTLTYLFEPSDAGTAFTRRIEIEARGYVRMLAPVVRRMIEKRQASFVRRLKDVLEASWSKPQRQTRRG